MGFSSLSSHFYLKYIYIRATERCYTSTDKNQSQTLIPGIWPARRGRECHQPLRVPDRQQGTQRKPLLLVLRVQGSHNASEVDLYAASHSV